MRTGQLAALLMGICFAAMPPTAPAADEFTIEAKDFDDGNVRVSLPGKRMPTALLHLARQRVAGPGGVRPRVSRDGGLHAVRPCTPRRIHGPLIISLDGKPVHTGFAAVTGSWQTQSAQWEAAVHGPYRAGHAHDRAGARRSLAAHLRPAAEILGAVSRQAGRLKRLSPEQRAERARLKEQQARDPVADRGAAARGPGGRAAGHRGSGAEFPRPV